MQRVKPGDRATVYWEDSWMKSSYTRKDDMAELGEVWPIETTGLVIHVSKDYIALSLDIDKDGDVRDTHSIYRKCITRIEKLVPVS